MHGKVWVVDDTPSTRFPIYTRGNVGEVFPDVVSPLSWSGYGGEAELGWREAWKDYGVLLDRDVEGEDKLVLGCFGGYAYLNASYIRVFAVRTPGVDVAAQMSHAVIVARELGIPAVVSATGATTVIPDGAAVEVDGTRGTVRILG
jgi:hypothetical protein